MRYRFAAAWRFLTIFSFPWWRSADEGAALRYAVPYFPLVGAVLGLVLGIVLAGISMVVPPLVSSALAVVGMAALSGGFHLDGLADSADALISSGRSREKALEIMKDSRLGAHGAMALVLLLLVKFACLASLPITTLPFAVTAAVIMGRAGLLFPMSLLPYAREKGLGGIFELGSVRRILVIAVLWSAGAVFVLLDLAGAYAFVAWLAVSLGWIYFLRRKLGGATGDSYGAACELCETAALFGTAIAFTEIWL